MADDLQALLDMRLRPLVLIWVAHFAALGAFAVALLVAAQDSGGDPMLPMLVSGIGVAMVPALGIVRFQLLGEGLGLVAPTDLRVDQVLTGEALNQAVLRGMTRYLTGTVVALGITEAIAILGFVSSFMTADLRWYAGHASVAVLLLLVQRPRIEGVLSVLDGPARKGLRQVLP